MTSIAACLIVKDGALTLGRAIASVRPFVDEVCVYDTGSTDGSLKLLEQLAGAPGAPIVVEGGEWRDDFGWAREQSFAMASSEWVLWIDADDELQRGDLLRGLVRRIDRIADGVAMQYVYEVGRDGKPLVVSANRRLVRRCAYRWVGRCHEELMPVDPATVREVIANPFGTRMVHWRLFGGRSDGSHAERNARILRLEVADAAARLEAWSHLAKSVVGHERREAYERFLELTAHYREQGGRGCRTSNPRLQALRELGRVEEADAERGWWVDASQSGELVGVDAIDPEAIVAADRLFGATVMRDVRRNDLCWCWSGRKAKACCGAGRVPVPLAVRAERGAAVDV